MYKLKTGLNNNQLKVIAMVAMLCDHIGRELLPQYKILIIIGRLAFPIFAYMIAEGCTYTSNKMKYFSTVLGVGIVCQTVFYITTGMLYQNILITFTLSIANIFLINNFLKKKSLTAGLYMASLLVATVFITSFLPDIISGFRIDYGLTGVLIPVFIRFAPQKYQKIILLAVLLIVLSFVMGWPQWYSLVTVPLILLYNGKRGKLDLKYMFYIFYPLHLAIIHLVKMLIR